jgi:flavin reductase (DIM6/NTAB) family NADH-FMN oxidoreductase RutF
VKFPPGGLGCGKVKAIHEPGDHALVIGRIVHAGMPGEGESLTCSDLRWHYAG